MRGTRGFYADEKVGVFGTVLDPMNNVLKKAAAKRCEFCDHSRAAHIDGVRCALCTCMSERREFVQQSLTFRSSLSTTAITRKR